MGICSLGNQVLDFGMRYLGMKYRVYINYFMRYLGTNFQFLEVFRIELPMAVLSFLAF